MQKVLIVDDESKNFEFYQDLLKQKYLLFHSSNSVAAVQSALSIKPDLVIMDFFLGANTGAECTRLLRSHERFATTPIIFVSGSNDINSKRQAFENGANDYLAKPFDSAELIMRIEASLKHSKLVVRGQDEIQFGNMQISPARRAVRINGSEIKLTAREYSILYYLVENRNQIVTSKDLIDKVWGDVSITQGNIYTQMYNLKTKIKTFTGELVTLNRVGFRLIEKPSDEVAI